MFWTGDKFEEMEVVFKTIAGGRRLALCPWMNTRLMGREAEGEIDATGQDGPDSGAESHQQDTA
jgi:hypothetical protein